MAFLNRWNWVRRVAAFPLPIIAFMGTRSEIPSFVTWSFVWMVVVALVTKWRLDEIGRRETQAQHGYIEITPEELCIRVSPDKLTCENWSTFQDFDVYGHWLHARFAKTHYLSLREIDNSDALVDILRTQTPAEPAEE